MSSRVSNSDQLRTRAKGAAVILRRNRSGSCCRRGWGTGLRPVHCHPLQKTGGALSRGSSPSQLFAVPSFRLVPFRKNPVRMNLFEFTRALVDIESTTNREKPWATFLFAQLSFLAARTSGRLERMRGRAASRQCFRLLGRASGHAFDAHGHRAAVFPFARRRGIYLGARLVRRQGNHRRDDCGRRKTDRNRRTQISVCSSSSAKNATAQGQSCCRNPRGARYLINGEPTEKQGRAGLEGNVRYEIAATESWRIRHIPELGDSAIEKLLDTLGAIRDDAAAGRSIAWQDDVEYRNDLRRPRAKYCSRRTRKRKSRFALVGDPAQIRQAVLAPLRTRRGTRNSATSGDASCVARWIPTSVVAFTTDIPAFAGAWGEPFLFGPGSIHRGAHQRRANPETTNLRMPSTFTRAWCDSFSPLERAEA